jgi:RES domain-containing protein
VILRPALLGGEGILVGWRLDRRRHAAEWASGEGAARAGGRWNSRGVRCVYASLDASAAILDVAVHKSVRVLDSDPHVMTFFLLPDPASVHVVEPDDVPNPNWLVPCVPSGEQQRFGDALLARHGIVALPSVVSRYGWNLLLDPVRAAGRFALRRQEAFALDPRLSPA